MDCDQVRKSRMLLRDGAGIFYSEFISGMKF